MHKPSHRKLSKKIEVEDIRENVERIEQQRIDFEHRARLLRTNLYNRAEPRDLGRGWIDAQHK